MVKASRNSLYWVLTSTITYLVIPGGSLRTPRYIGIPNGIIRTRVAYFGGKMLVPVYSCALLPKVLAPAADNQNDLKFVGDFLAYFSTDDSAVRLSSVPDHFTTLNTVGVSVRDLLKYDFFDAMDVDTFDFSSIFLGV